MKVFRVAGAPAELATALDRVLVRCEVLGLVEDEGTFTVAVAEDVLPALEGVTCEELSLPREALTGLEHDQVVRLAPDLVVRPPWVTPLPGFVGIELVVPRAMGFGSGEHESTQSALLAMHGSWPTATLSCADVGTGSGILLAYARARGARTLAGCDVEREAVAEARELLPEASLHVGGPETLRAPGAGFDTVLANLAFHEVMPILPGIVRLWNRRGALVIAGTRGASEAAAVAARVPARPGAAVQRGAFVAQVFVS